MHKNILKKAALPRVIVIIIATVIVLVVLLPLVDKFRDIGLNAADSTSCRMSNEASHRARINNYAFVEETKCSTLVIDVPSGQEKQFVVDALKETAIEYLGLTDPLYTTSDQVYCSFRRILNFSEDTVIAGEELKRALMDDTVTLKEGGEIPLIEYLEGTVLSNEGLERTEFTVNDIDTSQDYAIVFVQATDPNWYANIVQNHPGWALVLMPFGIDSNVVWTIQLMMVPYDKEIIVEDLGCTELPSIQDNLP